jgi:hypothetical protein
MEASGAAEGGSSVTAFDFDPRYVAARKVLLDALTVLAPHDKAIIVAGAQAIYLRTGANDIGIAPYTTDGDLAVDPTLLGDEPELEATMRSAGFDLLPADRQQPGIWVATTEVAGEPRIVPVDLIVPEAVAPGHGRRSARIRPHKDMATRWAVGLEAALIDHSTMTIVALDPVDNRSVTVEVAGLAAMLVAKSHKIRDRLADKRSDRLSDKDAADVYRIMQTARPADLGKTLRDLRTHRMAGPATATALDLMRELFGDRRGEGIAMAQRSLTFAIPEAQVAAVSVAFTAALLDIATA